MATQWDGGNLLVKLTGILRFCCEHQSPSPSTFFASYSPVLPPGYHRGQAVDEPEVITDPDPWAQLLRNHRLDGPRYTIIPSISIVPPWDNINSSRRLEEDQAFGESFQQHHYLTPTPVLPQPNALPSATRVAGAVGNATQRFYDALRVVMHGGSPANIPSVRDDSRDGVEAEVAGLAPHVLDSFDPLVTSTQERESFVMSPILQVCAALGVLVAVMMVLFHFHHFRRDCMTERRALRRVARRYHVARAQDDVERNDEVNDITL